MNKALKRFQLTTLGACLTLALTTGVMTTAASASSHSDEVRAAQAAKISLKQAINIASKEATGTLVSAEFDDDDSDADGNGGVYEVEFSTDRINYEIKIDAMTGKVVKSESERLDSDDTNDYKVQKKAKINIVAAMNLAEKQTGGQVMEIEFKNDRDYAKHTSYYEVEVLKGQKIIELNIDANTGSVFKRKVKK
ncbi:PepSY domain-containing protein [Psychrobacter sp. AOP22-C1-22]|uniref:PepSY domain-containing protein n=1 Tax=unclassified Psychrobacter TaxID=196806 RepID=UPI0017877E83|nr:MULTISPECIES: PepSY domain-containing protein [unclassified Psychrobacter]MBE0406395.1 PepSY domain-containing protein [Psychrobacter sp. FME6]MBE0443794.1 PepSY domain-containing protein [Psychrobacter sp. FME5]MDN5801570.1 PepSY domain-containing protein [Psychrobacter sp.]MDN5891528.1 PepSY domain-containing protein [Psychrobacter sp.]